MFAKRLLAALTALWLAPSLGQAAILFQGGNDISMVCHVLADCVISAIGGVYRTGWATGGPIRVLTAGPADPPVNFMATPAWSSAVSDVWIHFQLRNGLVGGAGTTNTMQLLRIMGSDGNPAVLLRGNGTDGQLTVDKRSTGGTITNLGSCTGLPTANLDQVDVHLVYAVSGSIELFKNSASVCTVSGDFTTDGRTQVNAVQFAPLVASNVVYISEVIVSDADTRAMNLLDLPLTGTPGTFQWTGDCTIAGQVPYNDSATITASASGLISDCVAGYASIPSGAYEALSVGLFVRALTGPAAPAQHLALITHLGGTDYLSPEVTPITSMSNFLYLQATNPSTGMAWNPTDVANTAGFQIGVQSRP